MDSALAGALSHLRHAAGSEMNDLEKRNRKTAIVLLIVVAALFTLAFLEVRQ